MNTLADCINRLVRVVWKTLQILGLLIFIVLAFTEGTNLFRVLFYDVVGKSASLEFTNYPPSIVYQEKSWWFATPRRYIVRPEKEEDSDENERIWVMRELKKNNRLGIQVPFVYQGPEGGVFEIHPVAAPSEEDE